MTLKRRAPTMLAGIQICVRGEVNAPVERFAKTKSRHRGCDANRGRGAVPTWGCSGASSERSLSGQSFGEHPPRRGRTRQNARLSESPNPLSKRGQPGQLPSLLPTHDYRKRLPKRQLANHLARTKLQPCLPRLFIARFAKRL